MFSKGQYQTVSLSYVGCDFESRFMALSCFRVLGLLAGPRSILWDTLSLFLPLLTSAVLLGVNLDNSGRELHCECWAF